MNGRPCDDCPHEAGCPGYCELEQCPTCKGRGTVNPLTAPKDFFCTGTTECPDCDGSGEIR